MLVLSLSLSEAVFPELNNENNKYSNSFYKNPFKVKDMRQIEVTMIKSVDMWNIRAT